MTAEIKIHGFETSNNIKVRVALGYKEIPYTFHTIEPANREDIIRLSGQRLTPVMVHGETVLFDSAAIIRYLEANFRDRPPLFGTSHLEQWAIEDMELFARLTLAAPMMEVVHRRVAGETVDQALQERCARDFAAAAETIGEKLGGNEWLFGPSMTIADITAAAVIYRVRQAKPFEFRSMGALADWEDRVLAFDRHLKRPGA